MEGEGASETGEGSKRKRGPEEESLISFGRSSDKDFELDWEDIARFQGDTEFKGYKFPTVSELDEMVEDLEDTLSSHMRKKGRDYIELKLDGGSVYGHFILPSVRKTSSVQEIKEMIEDSQQIKLKQQNLKFQGVTLADEEVLEGIPGLMDGSVIHIAPQGRAKSRDRVQNKGRTWGDFTLRGHTHWGQVVEDTRTSSYMQLERGGCSQDPQGMAEDGNTRERRRDYAIPTKGRRCNARKRRHVGLRKWGQFMDRGRAVIVWAALGQRMREQRFRRLQADWVERRLA